jgi:uncharacterized protein
MSANLCRPIALATACLFAACQSSPPTRYFALIEIAPTAPRALAAVQTPIRVERVTIPGELDRLELVRRSTSNRLQIATFDRWGAPLENMIRRVVAHDLAARFAPESVASAAEPAAGEPRRHLYIDVLEFAADEHGAVILRAGWIVQTPGVASARGAEEIKVEAADSTADAVAAAMSRALAQFADRIVAALAAQPASAKSE